MNDDNLQGRLLRFVFIGLVVVTVLLVANLVLLFTLTDRLQSSTRRLEMLEMKIDALQGIPSQQEKLDDDLRKLSTQARFLERYNDRKGDPLWVQMSLRKEQDNAR